MELARYTKSLHLLRNGRTQANSAAPLSIVIVVLIIVVPLSPLVFVVVLIIMRGVVTRPTCRS